MDPSIYRVGLWTAALLALLAFAALAQHAFAEGDPVLSAPPPSHQAP